MSDNIYNNGSYVADNPTWHEEDSDWKSEIVHAMLKKNNLNPRSICEVGCGSGEILHSLRKKYNDNVRLIGYDISKYAIELCNSKNYDGIEFINEDVLSSTFRIEDNLTLLMLIDVIEHIEDYYGALRKVKIMAKYKLFHVPLDLSVSSILRSGSLSNVRSKVGHIHYFTKDIFIESLLGQGYEIVDSEVNVRPIHSNNHRLAEVAVNRLRNIGSLISTDVSSLILGGASLLVLTR